MEFAELRFMIIPLVSFKRSNPLIIQFIDPFKLTSIILDIVGRSLAKREYSPAIPALLINISNLPKSFLISSKAIFTSSESATSKL